MIVRDKTPKSLSWAGRIAVLGLAALLLPLAPSWAKIKTIVPIEPNQQTDVVRPVRTSGAFGGRR